MSFIKGADILIKTLPNSATDQTGATFSEYIAIAGQQGASFSRTSETFNYNIKGDTWTYNESIYRNWEISGNGLYIYGDDAFDELQDDFIQGNDVLVEICFDPTETTGATYYYGTAIISDFSVDCPQDNMVNYSITLLGKGDLTEGTLD